MRSVAAAFTFLCVFACSGTEDEDPEPIPDETVVPDIDTGWPPGDLANIHIAHHVNDGTTGVYAAFTESSPGYVNTAQCAILNSMCIAGFADEDEFEELDRDQEIEKETIVTRFAGFDIKVGPYTLPYREDPDTKFGYYFYDASAEELPEGWIGASWGGQWPEYKGTEDLYVSRPIEIIQPAMDSHIVFTNGQNVPFEWVPTGEGKVTLGVFTRFTLARMYQLEDDGYFSLDADSLLLSGNTEDLTFVFTRWNESEVIEKGHVVKLVASSDVYFTGEYIQIGARTLVTPADQCAEAEGSFPLESGEWWGFLGGQINGDMNPNNGCLFGGANIYADARGNDAVFRLDVPGHHAVSVDYNVFEESAAVYFLYDCNNINSCFQGNDTSDQPDVHEYLNYFNPDPEGSAPRSIYLIVDETTAKPSVFTLDVTNELLAAPTMYDFCEDAENPPDDDGDGIPNDPPLTSGNYYADFVAYTGDLNPGTGGCTETSLADQESISKITLLTQETLTVSVTMPDGDPGVYLLYNCRDPFQCAVGSDEGGQGDTEQIVYQNQTAGSENLYIVVDSKDGGMRPYFMNVSIN
jgi:hypothetical protein